MYKPIRYHANQRYLFSQAPQCTDAPKDKNICSPT
jgi:hypothetical protein